MLKQFDVVELNNGKRAIIKQVNKKNGYIVEIVNQKEKQAEIKQIKDMDIKKIIYSKSFER